MNIVVCVKHVPDSTADRRFADDGTVDRSAVEGWLSELDEYAVEQALLIKERQPSATVTVLCVGPPQAHDAIRKALQMGADDGVLVSDDRIAGSDALATSRVLADAIRALPHDLVVCGMASTDGGMSVVPSMIAERLGIPQLTHASRVSLDGRLVTIQRDGDTATETIEAELPLVLSVTDQSGAVRYPSFKGIMAAKKKPVREWSLDDLTTPSTAVGLVAASTAVVETTARPARSAGVTVVDEDGSGAVALADYLRTNKLI